MEEKQTKINEWVKWIIQLVVVAGVSYVMFTRVVSPVSVNGSSMYPTLHDKDIAMINVIGLSEKNIKRFDVMVAYSEKLSENVVKRVIGLPGETIIYKEDRLYIDGIEYEEDFLDAKYKQEALYKYHLTSFTEDFEVTVGEGEYFLLGDNRPVSRDSRELGGFKYDDFLGTGGVVLFPFNHIKMVD